jgi:Zn-dependent protease
MGRGFRIFSVRGIAILVHPSWLIIFGLVVASLASLGDEPVGGHLSLVPRWSVAFLVAILFFASVLVHELAHALVARRRGMVVKQITLFLFGGAASLEEEPDSPLTEGLVTFAGPLSSAILGGLLLCLGVLIGEPHSTLAAVIYWTCSWLGVANLLLAGFNLIPGFPMDGGRILRAIIWGFTHDFMRATRVAALFGRLIGQLVIVGGLMLSLGGDVLNGVWFVLIGWFLMSSASMSYRQAAFERLVEGIKVRDVMEPNVPVVGPNLTLDTLAEQHLLSGDSGFYAVVADGNLVGTVDVAQFRRVPRGQWTEKRVGDVMREGDAIVTLTEPQPITEAVSRFEQSGASALPVVAVDDARRLLGMLTREGLLRALQARAQLRAAQSTRA